MIPAAQCINDHMMTSVFPQNLPMPLIHMLFSVNKANTVRSLRIENDAQNRGTITMYDHTLSSQRYKSFYEKMRMICLPADEWSNIQNIYYRLPQVPMKIILYGFHWCFTQKEEGRLH